jgi:hypothetical protein
MHETKLGQSRDRIAWELSHFTAKPVPTPTEAQVEEMIRLVTENVSIALLEARGAYLEEALRIRDGVRCDSVPDTFNFCPKVTFPIKGRNE